MSIFNYMQFQGNLKKTRYFEGWYFKHVSQNLLHVYSFIPGIALTPTGKHAFIQIIDGISGKTWNISYPLEECQFSQNGEWITIGDSSFSENGIILHIDSPELKVDGELKYSGVVKYPSSVLSPGIMGWYSYVPFMECKHGIGSVQHQVQGQLLINGTTTDFSNGTGYIEKDWGTSFPESWIWLHCNTFGHAESSFTFSVAKIPWLGSYFIGHICYLFCNGKFYQFATYNGSKIINLSFQEQILKIEIKSKNYTIQVKAVQNQTGELRAPVFGEMNRMIKESIDSTIELKLYDKKGNVLFDDSGTHAGMEIIDKILTYF